MSIHAFFRSLTSTPTRRRPIRRRPPASRLWLETLEDRCLLSFLPAVNYPVGLNPQAVVTGDFNGDGRLDLAVANQASNTVSILLGKGDGTFQAAQNFATGVGPKSLAVGDFNRDGKLDIVTANANDVSVLLGNGNGTFQAPHSIVLPGQFPQGYTGSTALPQTSDSVAVGDLNGDGKLDLVVRGMSEITVWNNNPYYGSPLFTTYAGVYLNVLLGNGDGSFTAKAAYQGSFDRTPPALGDFNGDGKLDLVEKDGNYLKVFPGNGDGTLRAPVLSFSDMSFGSMATGDLNGDGKLDLVTVNANDGTSVFVQKGNGDGTFQTGQRVQILASGSNGVEGSAIQSILLGDVNGDGKLDITAITRETHYARYTYYGNYDPTTTTYAKVLLGHGDGSFSLPTSSTLGSRAGIPSFPAAALGDFNGDGRPDLAAIDSITNSVFVALNGADWSTSAPQASNFAVRGFPSPATAGTAGAFTVTAKDASGNTVTNYSGTVYFTSSDAQAVLPPDYYTFTTADHGVHTFSAMLKTAGTQSLTVTEWANTSVTATQAGIIVNPAAASSFTVDGFIYVTAGANSFTVTAWDPYSNRATGCRGIMRLSSSDAKAVLPGNYTFTAADAGMHTFSVTLKTAGWQSLTATDTASPAITGTDFYIDVLPAAASRFLIGAPSSVSAGVRFSLTITVQDAYGNVVTGYTGSVHFQSTDGTASLPANYTFTAADKGVHTFTGLMVRKKGTQTITITDTLNSSLTGSVIENVL